MSLASFFRIPQFKIMTKSVMFLCYCFLGQLLQSAVSPRGSTKLNKAYFYQMYETNWYKACWNEVGPELLGFCRTRYVQDKEAGVQQNKWSLTVHDQSLRYPWQSEPKVQLLHSIDSVAFNMGSMVVRKCYPNSNKKLRKTLRDPGSRL